MSGSTIEQSESHTHHLSLFVVWCLLPKVHVVAKILGLLKRQTYIQYVVKMVGAYTLK